MANTKNSQAAKIRQQIITWLQDDQTSEVVSEEKFPGIRGIRAVKLRDMLGKLGYVSSVVMGAVSAAPSIDHRIKKAAVKPREVYYYFDSNTPAPAKVQRQGSTGSHCRNGHSDTSSLVSSCSHDPNDRAHRTLWYASFQTAGCGQRSFG